MEKSPEIGGGDFHFGHDQAALAARFGELAEKLGEGAELKRFKKCGVDEKQDFPSQKKRKIPPEYLWNRVFHDHEIMVFEGQLTNQTRLAVPV